MEKFKSILANRRRELKMTQRDLAAKVNVSDKTVSKWETGASYPDLTIINTLANVLEMDVNELLGAADIKAKTIEKEEYDYNQIRKFKNKVIITIGLFLLSLLIASITVSTSSNEIEVLLWVLSVSTLMVSLIFLVIAISNYRSFYFNEFHREKYDLVFYNCISVYLYIIMAIMIVPPLLMTELRIIPLFPVIFVLLLIYTSRKSYISYKKDMLNILMFSLTSLLYIVSVIDYIIYHVNFVISFYQECLLIL